MRAVVARGRRRAATRARDRATTRERAGDEGAVRNEGMDAETRAREGEDDATTPPESRRRSFQLPSVDEIKQRVSESAQQLGDVAHHVGDRLRDTSDKFARDVNERGRHVKARIRGANERVGKALAKKRWARAIAARLSPNSILVVAIAIALAGLPENRDKARRKAQPMRRRANDARRASSEARKTTARDVEDDANDASRDRLDDSEEETHFIGRGPTPRGVYEVVEGDTLCSIAGCFNLEVIEIIDKNGDVIRNPDALTPGDRIKIY
jgi:hypothetical protein